MGNRYLEIFQGKRSDYYAAIASVSSINLALFCLFFIFSSHEIALFGLSSSIITCMMLVVRRLGQLANQLGGK